MTEQEIIDYLKGNRKEGRIISFMPEEVKQWCEINKKELLVWQSDRWYKFDADDICSDDAVTLPDEYKVKEKDKLIGISCRYSGGDEVEINICKRALTKLAKYIMCVAQEGRHDPELDEVFNTIVEGARISRCKLPSDVFKAFKKIRKK